MAEGSNPDTPDEDEEDEEDEQQQQSDRRVRMKREHIKALEARAKRGDEADALRKEVAVLKAKLDLTPEQQEALFAVHKGDDLTPTALKATAVKLGWLKAETTPADSPETAAARSTSDALDQAVSGSTPPSNSGELTPQTVREWPVDKMMRFRREHPDKWEQIKRNQTVPQIAGY